MRVDNWKHTCGGITSCASAILAQAIFARDTSCVCRVCQCCCSSINLAPAPFVRTSSDTDLTIFSDAATMESPPSSPQLFGGIVQLARSTVVRMAEQTPVAVQPAILLAMAKTHHAEEDDSACTSECSNPESSRGDACRSPGARAAIGGRAQYVRRRGERRDCESERHDSPGKGAGRNSSSHRPQKELRRIPRSCNKEIGEGREAISKKQAVEAEISRAQLDLARMRAELSREPVQPRLAEAEELERLRGLLVQAERERDARVAPPDLAELHRELEELRQFRNQYPACQASALHHVRADASRRADMTRMEPMTSEDEVTGPEQLNVESTRRSATSGNRFNPLA